MLYLELFLTFFKIGLFTIGGGYAMLPLIQADVQAKGWMTAEELVSSPSARVRRAPLR